MIVTELGRADGSARGYVLIFGAGLIGRAILAALRLRVMTDVMTRAFDWTDRALRAAQLDELERFILARPDSQPLSIVWSAGKAGFSASEAETAGELAAYEEVLAFAERIAVRAAGTTFHLVSSAGGLFEGQRHVTGSALPTPKRPYGDLKFTQERKLLESRSFAARRVYRVTSAYGHIQPDVRAGLVSTLLINAAQRRPTRITGRMDTMRDFVFAGDVGTHVASEILSARQGDDVTCLAHGRPTSLFEVQATVEHVVGRKLHIEPSFQAANGEDITFSSSVQPAGWIGSDLRWNIGAIYRAALSSGALTN